MGYFTVTDHLGEHIQETYTCGHHNGIVRMPVGVSLQHGCGNEWHWCTGCNKRICGPCKAKLRCVPFEKKLDRFERIMREVESRDEFLRAVEAAK